MAAHHVPHTVCMLYLILSGNPVATLASASNCAASQDGSTGGKEKDETSLMQRKAIVEHGSERSQKEAVLLMNVSLDTKARSEEDVLHPWCFLSGKGMKWYHFDVQYSEEKCEDGACAAIELVRDGKKPVMTIHGGKQWLVKKLSGVLQGALYWGLYSPGPDKGEKLEINLLEVEMIKFYDAEKDKSKPDTLEIIISTTNNNQGQSEENKFTIEGGLYYDDKLLEQGLEDVSHADYEAAEKDAAQDSLSVTGVSKGKWVGGIGAALSVGGMYTAATIAGIAIQTQAVVGAAVVGIIGGTVAGALTGGLLGLVVAVGAAMLGYKKVRGHHIKPASRKIFEKLRCLDEFEECEDNVIAPKVKGCPGR